MLVAALQRRRICIPYIYRRINFNYRAGLFIASIHTYLSGVGFKLKFSARRVLFSRFDFCLFRRARERLDILDSFFLIDDT